MKELNFQVKGKSCPYCGKEYECLSTAGCRCEPSVKHNHHTGEVEVSAPCPCPDCVKAMVNQAR